MKSTLVRSQKSSKSSVHVAWLHSRCERGKRFVEAKSSIANVNFYRQIR